MKAADLDTLKESDGPAHCHTTTLATSVTSGVNNGSSRRRLFWSSPACETSVDERSSLG